LKVRGLMTRTLCKRCCRNKQSNCGRQKNFHNCRFLSCK
jgi:hypothetical protein